MHTPENSRQHFRYIRGGFSEKQTDRLLPPEWRSYDLPDPMQGAIDANIRLFTEEGLMPAPADEGRSPPAHPSTMPFAEAVAQVLQDREAQAAAAVVRLRRVLVRAWGSPNTSHEQRCLIARLSEQIDVAVVCDPGKGQ